MCIYKHLNPVTLAICCTFPLLLFETGATEKATEKETNQCLVVAVRHDTSAVGWQGGRYVCGLVSGCCPGRRLVGTSGWAAGDDSTESHMDVYSLVMRVSIICHCQIIQ